MPDVQAIATAIDADYQASKRNRKYFYNNASVNAVLESEKDISQDGIDKIVAKREAKYRGTDNAHKVGVLTGGLKYKPVNPSQKEMDFVESRRFNRDEILGFF
jgi:phage portal protein BeeE